MDKIIQKANIKPTLNHLKINETKYRENNTINLIKENTYNNSFLMTSNDSSENLDEMHLRLFQRY